MQSVFETRRCLLEVAPAAQLNPGFEMKRPEPHVASFQSVIFSRVLVRSDHTRWCYCSCPGWIAVCLSRGLARVEIRDFPIRSRDLTNRKLRAYAQMIKRLYLRLLRPEDFILRPCLGFLYEQLYRVGWVRFLDPLALTMCYSEHEAISIRAPQYASSVPRKF